MLPSTRSSHCSKESSALGLDLPPGDVGRSRLLGATGLPVADVILILGAPLLACRIPSGAKGFSGDFVASDDVEMLI